ncbi:MAG: phosphodiester glycosidase family protein [Hyphomicrobiales bacterium]|nr:phosphodiester glycosidase family protein [Hyphomicrobiales bacterium]
MKIAGASGFSADASGLHPPADDVVNNQRVSSCRAHFCAVLRLIVIAISIGDAAAAKAQDSSKDAGLCRSLSYGEASYVVCTIDLARYELRMFLRDPESKPYGSLARLIDSPEGDKLVFAMNGGMYDDNRLPIGLYIENGRMAKAVNTANGSGNFHLKPNGVFYASGDHAGVLETGRFLATKPGAEIATQSGPMLVIDGHIHPKFSEDSASRKLRNGVGVRQEHIVIFAISDVPVTFIEFARLFKDALACRDALFLDGSVSSLYAPSLGRSDGLAPLGPIIGAVERHR